MPSKFSLNSLAITHKLGDVSKRPFLFVHGNTQNDTCGKSLMHFFEEKGHTVCSYDLPGHGNSQLEVEEYKFKDLVDLNNLIVEHFNFKSPILCGHSIGSMIQAGTIAALNLNDASLILCGGLDGNPITTARQQGQDSIAQSIEDSHKVYFKECEKLFKSQKKFDYDENKDLDDSITQIINLRNTLPTAGIANISTMGNFSVREKLIEMNTPLLLLHGEKETVIPKDMIGKMLSEYSNAQIEWYPDNAHYAFYQQPQLTRQYLERHYSLIAK